MRKFGVYDGAARIVYRSCQDGNNIVVVLFLSTCLWMAQTDRGAPLDFPDLTLDLTSTATHISLCKATNRTRSHSSQVQDGNRECHRFVT